MILPILNILASLYLFLVVYNTLEAFEIKIDIHSITLAILCLLFLTFTLVLSDKNPMSYLGIGLSSGMLFLVLSTVRNNSLPEYTKMQKLILFVINVIFWSQIILFIWYYVKNYDKLKNNESI